MRQFLSLLSIVLMIERCVAFRSALVRSTAVDAATARASSFGVSLMRPSWHFQHYRQSSVLARTYLSSTENDNSDNGIETTWTYVPYQPPPHPKRKKPRRNFSSAAGGRWIVPKHIDIPEDKIDISFTRSSGAGGQNVNKLSTKADLRLHVMNAAWLPLEVRERLATQQANRINKDGILGIQSQEYRTQAQNKKSALNKLREMILEAYPRPKKRNMRKGLSQKTKERRKDDKRKRSQVKANRRKVDY